MTPRQGRHCFGHQKPHETVPAAAGRFPRPARSAGHEQSFPGRNPNSGAGQSCQGRALGQGTASRRPGPAAGRPLLLGGHALADGQASKWQPALPEAAGQGDGSRGNTAGALAPPDIPF